MRKITIPLAAVFAALSLTACAGGFGFNVTGHGSKVGSKCYVKKTGDVYALGHYRQVADGSVVCVEDIPQPPKAE
jgi:predicted small secreted protein